MKQQHADLHPRGARQRVRDQLDSTWMLGWHRFFTAPTRPAHARAARATRARAAAINQGAAATLTWLSHAGQISWRHSLMSDRCDAGCADGLLAAHVPPPRARLGGHVRAGLSARLSNRGRVNAFWGSCPLGRAISGHVCACVRRWEGLRVSMCTAEAPAPARADSRCGSSSRRWIPR